MNGNRTLAAQLAGLRQAPVEMVWGKVVSVQTGPASLTVNLDGNTTNVAGVRYSASYASPAAGDVIFGLRQPTVLGADVLILGKVAA